MTDIRSDKAVDYRRHYQSSRWKKLRARQLAIQPLCELCIQSEIVTEATVVHHVKRHDGDLALLFDPTNLQSLCKPHHDRDGQLQDNGKTVIRYDATGWPI